jgi:hypothetical protein
MATTPFCACEHVSHESECECKEGLHDVDTFFGVYTICSQCESNHPIPEEYRRDNRSKSASLD